MCCLPAGLQRWPQGNLETLEVSIGPLWQAEQRKLGKVLAGPPWQVVGATHAVRKDHACTPYFYTFYNIIDRCIAPGAAGSELQGPLHARMSEEELSTSLTQLPEGLRYLLWRLKVTDEGEVVVGSRPPRAHVS